MEEKWTADESAYCSRRFIKTYVLELEEIPYKKFVHELSTRLVNLSKEAITENVAALAYMADYFLIRHTCDIIPFPNYTLCALFTFVDQARLNYVAVPEILVTEIVKERYDDRGYPIDNSKYVPE